MAASPTVLDLLSFYLPRLADPATRQAPAWPPDLFGLMSALLERSGAYLTALERWPPKNFKDYLEKLDDHANDYKLGQPDSKRASHLVEKIFSKLLEDCGDKPLSQLRELQASSQAALLLMVIADQTFANFNRSTAGAVPPTEFEILAELSIHKRSPATLGNEIPYERLIILPKRRTPQTGLNIRSLSLHLAACPTSELNVQWIDSPAREQRTELNILFLPWPLKITPPSFLPVDAPVGLMDNMNSHYGWFTYNPPQNANIVMDAINHIDLALELCGAVDLLVLPECAINENQWEELVAACAEAYPALSLLAGVAQSAASKKSAGSNRAHFKVPFTQARQDKHHRWLLTGSQVIQYQLGPALNPKQSWWECMELKQRNLHFIQLNPWMLFAPLICEDLARPDPAGNLLRAVGPDLVVALLMDGPQLENRWAARNAITLADDPGSAVLSVTSAGMVDLSNNGRTRPRRTVALYKDPYTGVREIDLPADVTGILMTLSPQPRTEFSADGRKEDDSDTHPVFSGIQFLSANLSGPIIKSRNRTKTNANSKKTT